MTDHATARPTSIDGVSFEDWKQRAISAERDLEQKIGLIRQLRGNLKGQKKLIRKLKRDQNPLKLAPLQWQGTDPDYTTAETILGRAEIINTFHDRGFSLIFSSDRISTFHPSMDAAKKAALEKIEHKLRSAMGVTA